MLRYIDIEEAYQITRVFVQEFGVNPVHACVEADQIYFGGVPKSVEPSRGASGVSGYSLVVSPNVHRSFEGILLTHLGLLEE